MHHSLYPFPRSISFELDTEFQRNLNAESKCAIIFKSNVHFQYMLSKACFYMLNALFRMCDFNQKVHFPCVSR